jgi:hypothetical protein
MEQLLIALKKLYDDQTNIYRDEEWTGFKEDELYNEVVGLCNGYLITKDGQCNWNNILILRNNGYRVYAGEEDSFGWLVGCVQKKDDPRVIVYG